LVNLSAIKTILLFVWFGSLSANHSGSLANVYTNEEHSAHNHYEVSDTLPFPIAQGNPNFFVESAQGSFNLPPPENVRTEITFDPVTGMYMKVFKVGDRVVGRPVFMTLEQFLNYDIDRGIRNFWRQRVSAQTTRGRAGLIPEIVVGGELFETIFGGEAIEIRPRGSAELTFGIMSNRRDDPNIDERRRRTTNFDFQQKIQMGVQAKIGTKIDIGVDYNTEAIFDFDNRIKLDYRGNEDEILQVLEAGNVSLPLPGTLITGAQGLFGLKSELKFGNTTVTGVFSQQKTEARTVEARGGAQTAEFLIKADNYEENRHYFIGQYFRDNYDEALSTLPLINSAINITRMEVWVTNIGAATERNRNIVAFADLGERNPHSPLVSQRATVNPDNSSNSLYESMANQPSIRQFHMANSFLQGQGFRASIDYENIQNARLLNPNEYTFNPRLGFISLNRTMSPDHVLAVAFQYTIVGDNRVYQVGEFSNDLDAPNALVVKLLKSTTVNTRIPMWDLMMKNVYHLGAFQVSPENFILNILYESDELGVEMGFLTEGTIAGIPLIRVMNMDNLNMNQDPSPDGIFDFIDNAATRGGTIQSSTGRIYFPVVEPFGAHLRKMLEDPALGDRFAFDSLYRTTRHQAQQFPERNRFLIEGSFRSGSAGAEIMLNALNVPQGSVTVTAGGVPLTENIDYTVDYTLGRVRIINEAHINSGAPIRISLESSKMFDIQTKTLVGAHINHRFSDNFNVGASILRLSERPLTQKVNVGYESIRNTIWGFNTSYSTESQILTNLLNRLPFFNSTTPSRISFVGEFAHLIPGHSRRLGREGTSYIDDFEGSRSAIDMRSVQTWFLASTPQHQTSPGMFPEGAPNIGLASRHNVAKLAWYMVDPLFTSQLTSITPQHIRVDPNQRSDHRVRHVFETEIWPFRESGTANIPTPIPVLNLAFYPSEKGPYNYGTVPTSFSRGINSQGFLNDPRSRWGGIRRSVPTPDFEAAGIEFIEFWMMDPFIYNPNHSGGYLYFNLGSISEDILRDGRKSFENGLPTNPDGTNFETTIWGRVPTVQAVVNAFDNDPESRIFQDVGLDGLGNADERAHFADHLQQIATIFGSGSEAYQRAWNDPSSDSYRYFRSSIWDAEQTPILERYKMFNGLEGNSPTADNSPEPYPTSATHLPNTEDINNDGTLNEKEAYFQYRVSLRPQDMVVGQNFITDIREATVTLDNNTTETIKWYQFKIPLRSPERQAFGNIQDFKSIRFMRMFFKGFEEEIVCRFATLELVRGTWRTYDRSLTSPGEYIPDNSETIFEVSAVNIEENSARQPVPYVLPPGIEREIDLGTTTQFRRNEQSISLRAMNLKDGDARAVYKTSDVDVRNYRRIKMFVHAEAAGEIQDVADEDITVFLRLGADFTNNYYEYEVPLKLTPWFTSINNPRAIWPEENEIDLSFEKLQQLKLSRNNLSRDPNSGVSLTTPFRLPDGNNTMTIVGTPTLSNIKVLMIGVRNPKRSFANLDDDGLPKSAEIWINELRLFEFEDRSGWAATGRLNATLADLGNVTLAGLVSTPGFGAIDQKVHQRSIEQLVTYDVATNLELGKLTPPSLGLRIPMHFSYSETFINPLYNPLNPDILLADDLNSYETRAERDSIRHLVQDYTRRKSINFTNVTKTGTGPRRIYSPENFDFTYSYSQIRSRNVRMEYDNLTQWRLALGYNFAPNVRPITPFSRIGLFQGSAFQLIRDFNFNFFPNFLSFRTSINRNYHEMLMRPKSKGLIILTPNYMKTFEWDRLYDLRWDLTNTLRLEFSAANMARILEPEGRVQRGTDEYQLFREQVWQSIRSLGQTTNYNHRFSVNYTLPFNRIPILNWLNANVEYSGTYDWLSAPPAFVEIGNTIENSQTLRINTTANLVNLYNKIGFLQRINQRGGARPEGRGPQQGARPAPRQPQPEPQPEPETRPFGLRVIDAGLRMLMSVRSINVNFTESSGTNLPGFLPLSGFLGQDWNLMAPGTGFIFGDQRDIIDRAIQEGWITDDPKFNNPFAKNKIQNIIANAQVEPVPGLLIRVDARRNETRSNTGFLKPDENGVFNVVNPMETGSFSITFFSLNTAFDSFGPGGSSKNFERFREYRSVIANRLAASDGRTSPVAPGGFPDGYGPTSSDVLIPAFLAAYAGWDPSGSTLSPFLRIPMPNWTLTFDGLSRIPAFRNLFQNIIITHGYTSLFTVGNFSSDPRFNLPEFMTGVERDLSNDFISEFEIGTISISEQFNPLINVDISWHNSLITRFEYRKSRNITLSLANNQITDMNSSEIVVGTGYRIRDLSFTVSSGGSRRRITSDLILRLDLSIRDNRTVLRKLVEEVDLVSSGQRIFTLQSSAEYQLSSTATFRFFFDRTINTPFISNQFQNANTNAGISLRFMLR